MKNHILFLPLIALLISLGTFGTSHGDDFIVLGNGHAKIYVSNQDSGRFDFEPDGLTDFYVKAHFTGNANQLYKVDIKVEENCVDGATHDTAKMKVGFTNPTGLPLTWYTEGFEAWTSWFKSARSNDLNKQIDLVADGNPDHFNLPVLGYPVTGDDVIQKNPTDKTGFFEYKTSIKELDGQAGWEGSIHFNAPPGTYRMWSVLPGAGNIKEKCDTVDGITIPIIIT